MLRGFLRADSMQSQHASDWAAFQAQILYLEASERRLAGSLYVEKQGEADLRLLLEEAEQGAHVDQGLLRLSVHGAQEI